jgi:hypothetical protein
MSVKSLEMMLLFNGLFTNIGRFKRAMEYVMNVLCKKDCLSVGNSDSLALAYLMTAG